MSNDTENKIHCEFCPNCGRGDCAINHPMRWTHKTGPKYYHCQLTQQKQECICPECDNELCNAETGFKCPCTQQKDGGIEQILRDIKSAYDKEDPTAWGWGLQEIEKIITEARQQAFQESVALIAVEVMEVEMENGEAEDFTIGYIHGLKRAIFLINQIIANIEKRMKGDGKRRP